MSIPSQATEFRLVEIPVESRIIEEHNREVEELEQDMEGLRDIAETNGLLIVSQMPQLKECEAKTAQASKAVEQGSHSLKEAKELHSLSHRLAIFTGAGGAAGCALGAVGFAANPLAGVVAMVALGALGLGIGRIVGATT